MSSAQASPLVHRAPGPALHALGGRRLPVRSSSGLSTYQLRGVVAAIAAVHVVAIWGILQVPAVREAVVEAAPIFVNLLAPPAPPAPPVPPPPVVPPLQVKAQPRTVLTAPPAPSPAPFEAPPPPAEPAPPMPAAPVAIEAPPAPPAPPAPAAEPKVIPASAIQYLHEPEIEFPRASKRLGESGTVKVRVYVDEGGLPGQVQVVQSSGFSRLDEAAVSAVKKARFKPYTENGRPSAGWAFIPFAFDLEK